MTNNFVLRSLDRTLQFRVYFLIVLWLLGLIVGIFLSARTLAIDYPSVTSFTATLPSVFGLFICYLPVLLCIIGLLTDSFTFNCVVVLSESLCRGFCGFLIYILSGRGAWLLRSLASFSSILCAVLMWRILLRFYIYGKSDFRKNFYMVAIYIFLFIIVDQLLISPFLIRLSMYF